MPPQPQPNRPRIFVPTACILFCVFCNCIGWLLSAIHQLNSTGYSVCFALGAAAVFIWMRNTGTGVPTVYLPTIRRRFRRLFPLAFLAVATLELVGGIIHPPSNFDALVYRLPRILNWLSEGHWFWVPGNNDRLNYPTVAWEWIAAPFFALLRSDRGLFVIDVTAFLLMPGFVFSILRRTGVVRKVAWTWMWILPLGYGFALQAGSIGNDLTGVVFALASIFYALRARQTRALADIALAIMTAALLTGAKLSNAPLVLPCLVALWPVLNVLRRKWIPAVAILAIALLTSAAPTMIFNQIYAKSWNGDVENTAQLQVKNPIAGILGNGILVGEQAFMPPALPLAGKINKVIDAGLPARAREMLKNNFPRFFFNYLNELPQEEGAGLGISITLLVLIPVVVTIFRRDKFCLRCISLVVAAAWLSALVYMMKMGSEAAARLMLPYYPLMLIPLLMVPAQARLLRCRLWKAFALICALSVLLPVIVSPSRPLLPMVKISDRFAETHPNSAIGRRVGAVYAAYAHRNDNLAPLRDALPPEAAKILFVASPNDTDYSLWRPFGKRSVVRLQTDSRKTVELPPHVQWIVVKERFWPEISTEPLESWMAQNHARLVESLAINTLASVGAETWLILQVEAPANALAKANVLE